MLSELEDRKAAVEQKFNELSHAGHEAWQTLQSGFESAWSELHQSVQKAVEKF